MFKVVFLPLETPCFPERVPELRFYLTQYAPNLTHTHLAVPFGRG